MALCGSSCGLFSGQKRANAESLAREEQITRLQFDVMRLSEQAILDLSGSARQFSHTVGTPEAKRQALSWTVAHTNRVLSIASNPRPLAALVDLLLFASVQRIFHEEYWLPKVHGEADRPMFEAFQRLEASCWLTLGSMLDEKQQAALRTVLSVWREQNPDLATAAAVEAPSFADLAAPKTGEKRVLLVSDLIDLVSVDPLSGLEPAVREVTTARQLGERMFFYTQHMPRLLEQEAELLSQRTANLPEVRSSVEGVERFSVAAQCLADAAALLPQTLHDEREGLMADLAQAQAPLQELLAQSRATLDAGTRTAGSISDGIAVLDAFVSRPDATQPTSAAPLARTFDIREYGEVATRIGAAATELTAAITAADQRRSGLQQALDELAARLDRSVDHVHERALSLLFWAVALASAAVLLVRLLWSFLPRRSTTGGPSISPGSNGSHAGPPRQSESPRTKRPQLESDGRSTST